MGIFALKNVRGWHPPAALVFYKLFPIYIFPGLTKNTREIEREKNKNQHPEGRPNSKPVSVKHRGLIGGAAPQQERV